MNRVFLIKLGLWFSMALSYSLAVWLLIRPVWIAEVECNKSNPAAMQSRQTPMPDLHHMAALAGGGISAMPTTEQIEDEQRVENEQVELAHQWLLDADPDRRVSGAEQLAAYPTAEAGTYLIGALRDDPEPDVRIAAAQSLGYFASPGGEIFETLLAALSDQYEDVRVAAFNSILVLLDGIGDQPKLVKQIHAKFKQLIKKKSAPEDTLDLIQAYLAEREAL